MESVGAWTAPLTSPFALWCSSQDSYLYLITRFEISLASLLFTFCWRLEVLLRGRKGLWEGSNWQETEVLKFMKCDQKFKTLQLGSKGLLQEFALHLTGWRGFILFYFFNFCLRKHIFNTSSRKEQKWGLVSRPPSVLTLFLLDICIARNAYRTLKVQPSECSDESMVKFWKLKISTLRNLEWLSLKKYSPAQKLEFASVSRKIVFFWKV